MLNALRACRFRLTPSAPQKSARPWISDRPGNSGSEISFVARPRVHSRLGRACLEILVTFGSPEVTTLLDAGTSPYRAGSTSSYGWKNRSICSEDRTLTCDVARLHTAKVSVGAAERCRRAPGTAFDYHDDVPELLGMILERMLITRFGVIQLLEGTFGVLEYLIVLRSSLAMCRADELCQYAVYRAFHMVVLTINGEAATGIALLPDPPLMPVLVPTQLFFLKPRPHRHLPGKLAARLGACQTLASSARSTWSTTAAA